MSGLEGLATSPLLFALGQALAKHATLRTIQWFREVPPVERAARATQAEFPDLVDLATTLLTWLDGTDVRDAIMLAMRGDALATADDLLESFTKSGFYDGDRTVQTSRSVLTAFGRNVLVEVLKTDDGLMTHDDRTQYRFDEVMSQLETMQATQQSIVSSLSSDPETQNDPAWKEIGGAIKSAKELIDAGQLRSAQLLLRGHYHGPAWQQMPSNLRFRVATNLGCCSLGLEDIDEAHRYFDEALELSPEDARALSNASVVSGLDGRWLEALRLVERAMALPGPGDYLAAAYVRALIGLDRWPEVDTYVATHPEFHNDPAFCLTLGDALAQRGEMVRASEWLERARRSAPHDVHALVSSTRSRLELERQKLRKTAPLAWQLSDADRATMIELSHRLEEAIDQLASQDFRSLRSEAHIGQSFARLVIGDKDGSLTHARKAVDLTPGNESAHLALAVSYVAMGDPTSAILELQHLTGSLRAEGERLQCWVLRIEQRWSELAPLARAVMNDDPSPEIADFYLEALEAVAPESVPDFVHDLTLRAASEPTYLSTLAAHYERNQNTSEASRILTPLLGLPASPERDRGLAQLASIEEHAGNHGEAARIYGSISDPAVDSPWARHSVVALFNAGEYRKALDAARTLRMEYGPLANVTEVEAEILTFAGNFGAAAEVLDELISQSSSPDATMLKRVPMLLLEGEDARATDVLARVREERLESAESLMSLAGLRRILGLPGALSAAYSSVEKGVSDPNVLLAYCGFLIATEERDSWAEPLQRAAVGTAVVLKRGDARRVWILTAHGSHSRRELSEVSVDDELGKKLVGLSEGETVVLKANEESWEVVGVHSRYAGMAQAILGKFEQLFPENAGLRTVRVTDDDFSEFLKSLDERSKFVTGVIAQYRAKHITLENFAKFVGSDPYEVWISLTSGAGSPPLFAATGTPVDMKVEHQALIGEPRLVVELTTALAMSRLDLLDVLAQWPGGVTVSAWLVRELSEQIWKLETQPAPAGTAMSYGGRFYFEERTAESRSDRLREMRRLRDWCRTSPSIAHHEDSLGMGRDGLQRMRSLLGRQAAGALLAAARPGHALLSDDMVVRAASGAYGVRQATWSQPLLREFHRRSFVTTDALRSGTAELSGWNYISVSVSHTDLVWAFEHGGVSGVNLKKMLWSLRSDACSADSAIRVAAGFLAAIWLSSNPTIVRNLAADLTLNALSHTRLPGSFLEQLNQRLGDHLRRAPLQRADVADLLSKWAEVRSVV